MSGGARNLSSPYRHSLAVSLDATANAVELSTGLGTTLVLPATVDAPIAAACRHIAAALAILLRHYINGALDAVQPRTPQGPTPPLVGA